MDDQQCVSFTVRGTPTPKGSTTRMPHGGTIPAGTPASRQRMEQWRNDIRHAAAVAMAERQPFDGGIRLFVEFALMPPKSMPKRLVGWNPHTKKPDVDKLLRAICDALTGIVWRDDSQVCIVGINKVYAWDGITGAVVTCETITEQTARYHATASQRIRELVR